MKTVSYCVILLGVLLGLPAHALEPLAPYDNFNTGILDPNLWFGEEFGFRGRDAQRQIEGKRLHLVYRAYGSTGSDTGRPFSTLNLDVVNPTAVTALAFTAQVKKFISTGCPGNVLPTQVLAWSLGAYFNTDTPTAGSAVNDVRAFIGIGRRPDSLDPPNVLRVLTGVAHCLDALCTTSTFLDSDDLGPINVGKKARLQIQWDSENDQFLFQRDEAPPVVSSYTVSDAEAPGLRLKDLSITHFVANCTTAPRPVGFLDAFFDDVFVNESAAP